MFAALSGDMAGRLMAASPPRRCAEGAVHPGRLLQAASRRAVALLRAILALAGIE
jgi:hypothetical protein